MKRINYDLKSLQKVLKDLPSDCEVIKSKDECIIKSKDIDSIYYVISKELAGTTLSVQLTDVITIFNGSL